MFLCSRRFAHLYFCLVVFVTNPVEEKKRVNERLDSLQSFASSSAGSFWEDREKGFTMALFQDRIEQAKNLLVKCRDCLDYFHNALFPLNPCPESLVKLLKNFKDGTRVLKFIHREMISGAWSALAWVKIHHPQIDLEQIADGLPDNGQEETIMAPYYDVAFGPAKRLIGRVHAATRRIRQAQNRDIREMSCIPELVIADVSAAVAERRRAFIGNR